MCHFLQEDRIRGWICMEQNAEYRQKIVQEHKKELEPLLKYLPWLRQNAGKPGSHSYQGQGIDRNSMSFPVYDSNLMNFVREASASPLMDQNYRYVYSRNFIRNHNDERRIIARAELKDWDVLKGILSKYVLGGRTKALLWSEAEQENIFVLVLEQMHKIVEYWDKSGR